MRANQIARCYLVLSPEVGERVDVGLEDGNGPMEYWQDHAYVYTRNARRAKVLALRLFRRQYRDKGRDYLDYDCPFVGMSAERARSCERCGWPEWRGWPCLCCETCEGTGDGSVHGVEGMCGACNGSGREEVKE